MAGGNGKCAVCNHPERMRIELLLVDGAGQSAIGRKFGMSKHCVSRHWLNHVTGKQRAALAMGPVGPMELAARVAEESQSILDHHKVTRATLYTAIKACQEAGDAKGIALLTGRLTSVNEAIGRLTGQIAASPFIQNNNLTLVMGTPEVRNFLDELSEQLEPFPEAHRAVIHWLETKEAAMLNAAQAAQEAALPALEHQG
jgi:hypothetical protein